MLKVLLVEDDECEARKLHATITAAPGIELNHAPGLDLAFTHLERGPVDLVLLDLGPADARGIEILESLNAQSRDAAIIVLTDSADRELAAAALRAGAEDCLVKGQVDGAAIERATRHAVERHGFHAALRASEARYRTLVDSIPDVAWSMDANGCFLFVSPRSERVWGRRPDEILFSGLEERLQLVHPEDRSRMRDLLFRHFTDGGATESEIEYRTVQGRWIREHWGVPYGAGATACCSGIASDVTASKEAERELARSRARLQAILDHSQDAILLSDASGRYVDANSAACRLLGWTRDEILSQHRVGAFTPESAAEAVSETMAIVRATGSVSGEHVLRRRDGSEMAIQFKGVADVQPGVDLWLFTDITFRRRAEALTRLLASVVENSDDAIVTKTLDGIVTSWNRGAERMFGWTSEEMIGSAINRIIPEEGLPQEAAILARLAAGERIEHFDTLRLTKDGRTVEVSITASPLRGDRGEVVGVSKIGRDITARKRAERALVESEARLQRAQRIARLGAWELSLPEGTVKWSDEVFRILGVDAGATPTISLFMSHVHPDDRARLHEAVDRAIAEGGTYQVEHRIRRADGAERIVSEQAEVLRQSSGGVTLLGTLWDVTDRKQLEQQFLHSQKMEAVGQLAGGVAHDFNNLLTIIGGYASILLDELPPDDHLRDHAREISASGERAAALTRQLLAFSRKQMLRPTVIAIDELVHGMERMLRRLLGEHIGLVVMCDPNPCRVLADAGQMEQVLMNLAVNARDAMPEGGKLVIETSCIELTERYAETHADVQPGAYVMMIVSDTGNGMDRQTIQRAFEPFFTTKAPGHGTGLGLSTVYGIVRQSNGHIWVYSEQGRGTTFKIYLPRIDSETEARRVVYPSALERLSGRETVLLVEDEEPLRKFAVHVLQRHGYDVLAASEPDEALALLKEAPRGADILVTDVVLPGRSGRRLAQEVLEQVPGMPVVYMSGYTPGTIQQHGLIDADANFLQKPFTPTTLVQKIREVLDAAR